MAQLPKKFCGKHSDNFSPLLLTKKKKKETAIIAVSLNEAIQLTWECTEPSLIASLSDQAVHG